MRKSWGTYFNRLVNWDKESTATTLNQLEEVIDKIRRRVKGYKAAYSVTIFSPAVDRKKWRKSPCLSHIEFYLYNAILHLLALYRNQEFINKAYGNYLGLSRLLHFVAGATGLMPGLVTCWAGHAFIEDKYGPTVKRMIRGSMVP